MRAYGTMLLSQTNYIVSLSVVSLKKNCSSAAAVSRFTKDNSAIRLALHDQHAKFISHEILSSSSFACLISFFFRDRAIHPYFIKREKSYKLYFFYQTTMFFFYDKSTNNAFSHDIFCYGCYEW